MVKLKRYSFIFVLIPFFIIVIGFEILPLIVMGINSFKGDFNGPWTFAQYVTALTNKYYLVAIKNSVAIAFFSSVVAMIIAIIGAYSITKLSKTARDLVLTLSNMTSNFAGVPLAFAYIILLGNNGLFTLLFHKLGWSIFENFDLYSWVGLTIVYIYFQLPLALLLLYPAYYGIQSQWKEAASLLGASKFTFWKSIGLPIILPGIVGTFSVLFANAMGAYATAYALVGSNYNLLVIRIGSLVSGDVSSKPELAGALSVILGLIMIIAMFINERMMKRVRRDIS